MRCTFFILLAVAMPIIVGCSNSRELEKAQEEARAATAELEKLRAEFELAKLKAEKELAEAKAKQAEAEGKAAASEADADTSKAALGLIGRADLPPVTQPDPEWTPQELLAAYFNAPSWLHRVPLVKDCERVEPLMKSHYALSRIKPMEFEVLQLEPESADVGGTLTATVKLATHNSDYVIFRSAEGYRIDWEASQERWRAAEEANFREAHGLIGASIEVKLVKRKGSTTVGWELTELTFEITNRSEAHLAFASIGATAFGQGGQFLQKSSCNVKDLLPGESTFESIVFLKVAPPDLKTWKLKLSSVSIKSSGEETVYDVDKYFELKEMQNNAPDTPEDGSSTSYKADSEATQHVAETPGDRDKDLAAFQEKVAKHLAKVAKEGQTPETDSEALALQRERNELLTRYFQKGQGGFMAPRDDGESHGKSRDISGSHFNPSDYQDTQRWIESHFDEYQKADATHNEFIRQNALDDFHATMRKSASGKSVRWSLSVVSVDSDEVRLLSPRIRDSALFAFILCPEGYAESGAQNPDLATMLTFQNEHYNTLRIGETISLSEAKQLAKCDSVTVTGIVHGIELHDPGEFSIISVILTHVRTN